MKDFALSMKAKEKRTDMTRELTPELKAKITEKIEFYECAWGFAEALTAEIARLLEPDTDDLSPVSIA